LQKCTAESVWGSLPLINPDTADLAMNNNTPIQPNGAKNGPKEVLLWMRCTNSNWQFDIDINKPS